MSSAENSRSEIRRQLALGFLLVLGVCLGGTAGYYVIGQQYIGKGAWTLADCLYMTFITISTVGFGETLPNLEATAFARTWTMVLILLGSGSLLFFASTVTAFIVEGDIQGAIRRRRMESEIDKLRNHIIVVGAGATGIHVIDELYHTKTDFVVIDINGDRLSRLEREKPGLKYVVGNATDDEVLERAGILRATALAATLPEDKDNVFVAITARALKRSLRIVSKVTEDSADMKLRRAGADSTVSPSSIGGMRIASELVRPSVVQFLDKMLRDREGALRVEELEVPEGSTLVGSRLADSTIRDHFRVLVLAARGADGNYTYNPGPDFVIEGAMTLVLLTQADDLVRLRRGVREGTIGARQDGGGRPPA